MPAIPPDAPVLAFIDDALRFYMEFHSRYDGFYGAFIHDALAVAAALEPALIRTESLAVQVELSGRLTTGETVTDWRRVWGREPNLDVAVEADVESFFERFIDRVGMLAAARYERGKLTQGREQHRAEVRGVSSSTLRIIAAIVAFAIVAVAGIVYLDFAGSGAVTSWAYVTLAALGVAFVVYAAVEYAQTRRLESITRQFDTRTIVLIPIAIALNIILGQAVSTALKVPIYLDSVGTILVGALAGPIPGALTGLLANVLWTFIVPPPFQSHVRGCDSRWLRPSLVSWLASSAALAGYGRGPLLTRPGSRSAPSPRSLSSWRSAGSRSLAGRRSAGRSTSTPRGSRSSLCWHSCRW